MHHFFQQFWPKRSGTPPLLLGPWRGPVEQELASTKQQLRAHQDLLVQTQETLRQAQRELEQCQADFVRLKRRTEMQSEMLRLETLKQLLPAIEQVRSAAYDKLPFEMSRSSWVQGLRLIVKELMDMLVHLGVQRFGKLGKIYTPLAYEVIGTKIRQDLPEGTILEVLESGYVDLMTGGILRPARVIVSCFDTHAP